MEIDILSPNYGGYNDYTRTIGSITTGTSPTNSSVQNHTFEFDAMGNLTSRADVLQQVDPGTGLQPLEETFTYDALNRVTTSSVTNQTQKTYDYDTLGNITSKTGIGSYTYSGVNAGPHAVTTAGSFDYLYDANGNQTEKKSGVTVARDITYTAFNKPKKITKGGTWVEFTYGADRARIKQVDDSGTELIYVAGSVRYERKTKTGGATEHLHYLAIGGEVISIYQSQGTVSGGSETPVAEKQTYLHRDHLGSVVVITDDTGAVLERLSYDVWGKRRDNTNWQDAVTSLTSNESHRGYTGHEMLDSVGLVHMNGRVYDPDLARFTSADPFIPMVDNPQAFNRYSYVLNNPLSFTDPSGFFFKSLFKAFKSVFKAVVKAVKAIVRVLPREVRTIASIGVLFLPGAGQAAYFAKGFASGFIGSGGDLKSGLIGAATAAAFFRVGGIEGLKGVRKAIAHGVVGGISSEAQGGSFLSGFASAGTAQFLGGQDFFGDLNSFQEGVARIAIGGLAAEAGGGKFANGAATAAMSYAFGSLARNGGSSDNAGQSDIISMSDQELDAYIEAQYGDQLDLNTDMLLAECGGCMVQQRMQEAYFAGNATEADLMGLYRAQAIGAVTGYGISSGARALWATQLRRDFIRFGDTVVSNQLVRGQGVSGASVTWGVKGGGPGLPFHYHIHRYNWYRPWTWFRHTPIIKP